MKVNNVICHGESGGGNLSIASAIKANSNEILVDGVYACCPYISNCYDNSIENSKLFPSLIENGGYTLDVGSMHLTARLYTEIKTPGWRDGLAWPHHATDEQLKLLPKTVISVNELDPLRDEGLFFSERIKKLGVAGYSKIVKGTTHGAEICLQKDIPDISAATLDDVVMFAKSI